MSKPSRKNSPSSAESAAPATAAAATGAPFAGLDLLSSSVLVLDAGLKIRYINSAAENLLAVSSRSAVGALLGEIVEASASLHEALDQALAHNWGYTGQGVEVRRLDGVALQLNCTVNPVEAAVEANGGARLLLELWPIDQQLRATREERLLEQQLASRELIRNLAHEIKNPLGGIRGSAQLLERELDDPQLREYTQVIIAEADRLQDLLIRLLTSHRMMQPTQLNLHDVVERVRRLILAEFPGVAVRRDYDTSLPLVTGDREQLIQAILNIARNAAQAMQSSGEIVMRTRAARQVTLAKRRFKLAVQLQVIDNGPGIPDDIRDRIFYPLVSGRENGSGLGLSLAQSFVEQHHGAIEVESRPGRTCFTIFLPITRDADA